MNLPEINKTYNYFDDGKIKETRRMSVVITEIIPFDKIEEDILDQWKEEVENCDWLYAKETDYFIKGILETSKDGKHTEEIVFVRTIDDKDGWFSLGWWGGRLDLDGNLLELSNNRML